MDFCVIYSFFTLKRFGKYDLFLQGFSLLLREKKKLVKLQKNCVLQKYKIALKNHHFYKLKSDKNITYALYHVPSISFYESHNKIIMK